MPVQKVVNQGWAAGIRRSRHPARCCGFIHRIPQVFFEQSIQICAESGTGEGLHAAGSHWALSEAAVSDHTFVETHTPKARYSSGNGPHAV